MSDSRGITPIVGVAVFFVVVIGGAMFLRTMATVRTGPAAPTAVTPPQITPEQQAEAAAHAEKMRLAYIEIEAKGKGLRWNYDIGGDPLDGRVVRTAAVKSLNEIDLQFPYRGPQRATLTLRRHPRFGNEVIFEIERGQFLCHSYSPCDITIKFGDSKPIVFKAGGASDNSTNVIFIRGYDRFMKNLSGAAKLAVEVPIYQAGSNVFTFNSSSFEPEQFAASL